MGKKAISPDVYDTTLSFLEDRIRIYSLLVSSSYNAETSDKYRLMKEECEEMLNGFTRKYTWRKRRYARKTEKAENQ